MKIYLVRHAKAEKRAGWDGPDALRPLAPLGLRQAEDIAARLGRKPVERILSSPYLRCRQTVEPLAKALGLAVEVHERLAEGERTPKALELLRGLEERTVVCCTHTQLVKDLAAELEECGVEIRRPSVDREAGDAPESARLAALDLGSTSFHMLVADVTRAGRVVEVARERRMLRLGAAIARDGRIPAEVGKRAVAAAGALRTVAERAGAEQVLPVGTSALRDAENGAEWAARIGEACGRPVRLLSGEEEARLMFRAFRHRILLPSGPTLGIDLGGGSLELAVGDAHAIAWEATLPLGAARLHREIVGQDPMRKREARAVWERVSDSLRDVREAVARLEPGLCVAAGGSARALAHLAVALRGLRPARSINQLSIPLAELRQVTDLLVHSTHDERLRLPGIRRRRADLMPTAMLVLSAVAETLGLEGYVVSDWGLREGVLLEAIGA